jgi:hypothetical protein
VIGIRIPLKAILGEFSQAKKIRKLFRRKAKEEKKEEKK